MGGLRTRIPWTFWTFVIGTLAIAGIWPLAGYYSKDEILLAAWNDHRPVLFAVALFTALLTAFYMTRLVFMTFFGQFRGGHDAEHHVHESPWTMLGPLVLLAIGSAVVGKLVPVPHIVEPALRLGAEAPHHVPWVPIVALGVALAGIAAAYYLYVLFTDIPAKVAASFAPLYRLFDAKYYFDTVYYAFVDRVVLKGSDAVLWKRVDAGTIDGAVNTTGTLVDGIAGVLRFMQTGLVRSYAFFILGGAVALLGFLLWP